MSRKKRKKKNKKKTRRPSSQQNLPPKNKKESPPPQEKQKKKRFPFILIVLSIFLLGAAAFFVFRSQKPQIQVKKDSSLNVLLITLDTTRSDRLGCYGYSKAETTNLDSLSENGVRFENAYCQVPLTTPSHCSILTGTYPLYHKVRNNGQYYLSPEILTVAEVLKNKGLKTAAFVSSFTVDSRFGLDQGFDVYDDKFAQAQAFKPLNSERRAEQVYSSFAQWMEKNSDDQFFCWVHFFDPHIPYAPPSPYRENFSDRPYDGEIAYMDEYVGKIIDKLRGNNLMDKTIIIAAGDHGEALGEKGERGHGVFLYEPTMRVPLIFYAPKHLPEGETIHTRVRLIDLMPSILDMLEISAPEEIQGKSLLPIIQNPPKNHLNTYIESYFPLENFGWHPLIGLIDGDWKYIKAPQEELYNLDQDPQEQKNLLHERKKIHLEKKKKLEQMIEEFSSSLDNKRKSLSSQEMQRLRSLGYIGGSATSSQGELPDPKEKVDELQLIQRALQFELEQNYKESASIYKQLISMSPDGPTHYVNLALMQAQMKEFDKAIQTLEQGLAEIPDSEVLLHRLGHTYLVTGKTKQALDTFLQLLKLNPQNFDALLVSAWILNSSGEKQEAQKHFQKALEIEPENKFARKNYAICLATSGRLKEAIKIFNDLKKKYPKDHEIYQALGIAYGSLGDLSKSIQNLEEAIQIRPTPTAYFNLAVAMKKNSDLEGAAHYLRLYLKNTKGENEQKILQARYELQNIEKKLKK